MTMETLNIGNQTCEGADVLLPGNVHLLVIRGGRGLLGCGYLSMGAAEKFGHALAIVRGVASYEDMLAAEVQEVSAVAAALGVRPGMTGREALGLMA